MTVFFNGTFVNSEGTSSEINMQSSFSRQERQGSGSNDSQSETLQIFENLKSIENFRKPDFDISSNIDTAK